MVMPSIGFGSNKKTRHMMPSGHKAFLVHNVDDVKLLLMHSKTYAAEIAHSVSSRKRIEIIEKAKQLNVKVCQAYTVTVLVVCFTARGLCTGRNVVRTLC